MSAGQLLQEALGHHQAGRLQQALSLYQQALALEPENADALHLSGLIHHQQGNSDQAAELIGQAVKLNGNSALYSTNYAVVLNMLGRFQEAETAAAKATQLAADSAEAWHLLGIVRLGLSQFDPAQKALVKAVGLDANNVEYLNNLGTAYRNLGNNEQAIATFRRAVAADPDFVVGQTNLAEALKSAGELSEAEALCLSAIEKHPDHATTYHVLGGILMMRLAYTAARETFEKYVELSPHQVKGYVALANVQNILGDYEEAETALSQALDIDPRSAPAIHALGSLFLQKGDKSGALRHFKQVIELEADNAQAYFDIANADATELTDENQAHLESLMARGDIADANKATASFALARVAEKSGASDAAFAHLEMANNLRRAVLENFGFRFDAEKMAAEFDTLRNFYDQTFFDQLKPTGSSSNLPVFVVGLPRTGTTLVERIIASHADADGAGELLEIENIINGLKRQGADYPGCLADIADIELARLATHYLTSLTDFNGSVGRIVDKNPFNYIHLGFIYCLFPQAKIIHCRRDLCDVGLSCYSQNFSDPVPWTNDLGSIAAYFKLYQSLMVHWEDTLPAEILTLDYEKLVTDFETQARQIIAHLDLAWDENCLNFYQSEGAVQTASIAQVREPVYTRAVGRWQQYEKQLQPLIDALD